MLHDMPTAALATFVALLGPTGMTALVRIMGFLLVCVGVQFVALGVVEIVTDEKFLGSLVKGLKTAGG